MRNLNKLGAVAVLAWSATASSETLTEAAAFAVGNSPDVAIYKSQYLARIEQIGVSKAGYRPTIDMAIGYGGERTNSPSTRAATAPDGSKHVYLERHEASLTLSQLLYDGSRTMYDIERTKAEAKAQRYQLWSATENTTLEVTDAYMNLLHARDESVLAASNLEAHIEILDGIRKRSDAGLGSASDLSQIQGRLSRAHSNYLATDNNVLDAMARYYKVVGQKPTKLIKPEPVDQHMPVSYELALERAGKIHPTMLSAQFDVDAAIAQLRITDADFRPDVRVELGSNMNNNLDGASGYNNDLTAMVRLRYNLFSGHADTHRQNDASYQLMEAVAIKDRAQREIAQGLSLSWNAYQLLERQMEFLESHVIEAEKTLDAYKKQFQLGRRTLVDMLDAENELFESRKKLLEADRDRVLTQFRVLNATGDLLSVLNLSRESLLTSEELEGISYLQK